MLKIRSMYNSKYKIPIYIALYAQNIPEMVANYTKHKTKR